MSHLTNWSSPITGSFAFDVNFLLVTLYTFSLVEIPCGHVPIVHRNYLSRNYPNLMCIELDACRKFSFLLHDGIHLLLLIGGYQ